MRFKVNDYVIYRPTGETCKVICVDEITQLYMLECNSVQFSACESEVDYPLSAQVSNNQVSNTFPTQQMQASAQRFAMGSKVTCRSMGRLSPLFIVKNYNAAFNFYGLESVSKPTLYHQAQEGDLIDFVLYSNLQVSTNTSATSYTGIFDIGHTVTHPKHLGTFKVMYSYTANGLIYYNCLSKSGSVYDFPENELTPYFEEPGVSTFTTEFNYEKTCTCGGTKTYGPDAKLHSTWCDLYEKV